MSIGIFGLLFLLGKTFFGEDKPKPKQGGMQPIALSSATGQKQPQAPLPSVAPPSAPVAQPVPQPQPDKDPDPLETRLVHMTGCLVRHATGETICTFTVSQNGMAVFTVTSQELQAIGYEFKNLGHCASVLKWKNGQTRPVICDSPSVGPTMPRMS